MTGAVTEMVRRQYLLGDLKPEESAAFEETYFSDDAEFEQLLAAEEELIDEYARGGLSPDERRKVESALQLQSRQADRVTFARALAEASRGEDRRKVLSLPRASSSARQLLWRAAGAFAAMAAVLAAAVGAWSWYHRVLLERELAALQGEVAALRRLQQETRSELIGLQNRTKMLAESVEQQREPKREEPPSLSGAKIASLTLRPVLRGEPNANVLVIRPGTERVELKARSEIPYHSMRAAVTRLDGKEIWKSGILQPERIGSSSMLSVELPADLLPGREYLLRLLGADVKGGRFEEDGEYYFQVVRK